MVSLLDVFEDGSNLVPENFDGDRRVIKINIIDDGASEGIWAYIKNPEDTVKYDVGNRADCFDVILLNQPLAYSKVLRWGFVVRVKCNGKDDRPILNNQWLNEKIGILNEMALAEKAMKC